MTDISKPRPSRWFRVLRFCLFGVVALVTLVALIYAIENWRGERAWEAMKRELVAQGESLDFRDLIPPQVPDAENFAATPLLKPLLEYTYERDAKGAMQVVRKDQAAFDRSMAQKLPSYVSEGERERRKAGTEDGRTDWAGWMESFKKSTNFTLPNPAGKPAEDILVMLRKFDNELAELATASQRPYSRFPIHYEENFNALLPYLAVLKGWDSVFALRAKARLATGDVAGAFEDVNACFRLSEALREDPLLISLLVRIANHSIATRAYWEGFAEHQWTEPQLAAFQKTFAGFDFREALIYVTRGERAFSTPAMEMLINKPKELQYAFSEDFSQEPNVYRIAPRGLVRQNQVVINRVYLLFINAGRDAIKENKRMSRFQWDFEQELGVEKRNPYNALAMMLVPAFNKAAAKADRAQMVSVMGMTSCALERYRLAQGGYPESLSDLVPKYLEAVPVDLMDGQLLRYKKRADGWFDLYSVGYNGTDDGGIKVDDEKGDWIWPLPLPSGEKRLF